MNNLLHSEISYYENMNLCFAESEAKLAAAMGECYLGNTDV